MQFIGILLTVFGLVMIGVAFAIAVGWYVPRSTARLAAQPGAGGGFWDILKELVRVSPWYAVVGLILVYFGLRTLGVEIP